MPCTVVGVSARVVPAIKKASPELVNAALAAMLAATQAQGGALVPEFFEDRGRQINCQMFKLPGAVCRGGRWTGPRLHAAVRTGTGELLLSGDANLEQQFIDLYLALGVNAALQAEGFTTEIQQIGEALAVVAND